LSTKTLIAILVTAAIAAAPGCGSGGDSTSTGASGSTAASNAGGEGSSAERTQGAPSGGAAEPGPAGEGAPTGSLTKAQFVKQANTICKRERPKLLAGLGAYLQKHKGQDESSNALAATKAVLTPGMEAQIEAIRRLGAPRTDAKQIQAFLVLWQAEAEEGSTLSDPRAIGQLFADAGKAARKVGLAECAYG